MQGRIEALYIYPVKSCAGIKLDTTELLSFGMKGDREWMIVGENGTMVTQRKNAKLALIQPFYKSGTLTLQYPQGGSVSVTCSTDAEYTDVSIWKDSVAAVTANNHVNQWLTKVLQSSHPLKLVQYNKNNIRTPGQPERFNEPVRSFADAAPLLIANIASLVSLNKKLIAENKPTVDMRSFRPNIVVSGLPAFSEHEVSSAKINDEIELQFVDHCERCVIITIDQDTGIKREKTVPYTELAQLNAMPGKPKAAAFGVNATADLIGDAATISVNDPITFS